MDPRSVHIDDTDPRFTFRGGWTAEQTTDPWGLSGTAFNLTLHQTASDGIVIFRFKNGMPLKPLTLDDRGDRLKHAVASALTLFGNIDTLNNRPKPSWTCSLDGKTGDRIEAPVKMRSHFSFCKFSVPDGGEHQLTMAATVPLGGILAIDAIALTPAKGVTISEGEVMQIHHSDSAVVYTPPNAWIASTETGSHDTSTPNSSVQFNFTGSSVLFSAVYIASETQSPGLYTIDGGLGKNFIIPKAVSTSYHNVLFFEEGLAVTNHSLSVIFNGNSASAPLSLGYFYVTLPPGQSPLVSTAQIVETYNETARAKPSQAGAIAGGVVGGVVGLAIIVTVIVFLWRRHRSGQDEESSSTTGITPFVEDKPPETIPSTSAIMHPNPPLAGSSILSVVPQEGKPGTGPIVISYEPKEVEVQHEDSEYGENGPSTSGIEGGVVLQDDPPPYSAT